jgi:outer membrane murein-binding lipoprotein Lpp
MLTTPMVALAMFSDSSLGGSALEDRASAARGVEKGQGDIVEQFADLCGLKCKFLADGEATISGNAKIDSFFSATLTLQAQAASLEAEVKAELVSIAAAAGVEGAAEMEIDELSAAIEGEVTGGFGGVIEGELRLEVTPPRCEVSASASVEAAAKCDVDVKGGEAKVECSGSCEASADVMAECSGSAELKCKGTAPSFSCEGTCTGTCPRGD